MLKLWRVKRFLIIIRLKIYSIKIEKNNQSITFFYIFGNTNHTSLLIQIVFNYFLLSNHHAVCRKKLTAKTLTLKTFVWQLVSQTQI